MFLTSQLLTAVRGLARFSIAWMPVFLTEFMFPEMFKISAVYCVFLFSDLCHEKSDRFEM